MYYSATVYIKGNQLVAHCFDFQAIESVVDSYEKSGQTVEVYRVSKDKKQSESVYETGSVLSATDFEVKDKDFGNK